MSYVRAECKDVSLIGIIHTHRTTVVSAVIDIEPKTTSFPWAPATDQVFILIRIIPNRPRVFVSVAVFLIFVNV
jgi:hypothetical protein